MRFWQKIWHGYSLGQSGFFDNFFGMVNQKWQKNLNFKIQNLSKNWAKLLSFDEKLIFFVILGYYVSNFFLRIHFGILWHEKNFLTKKTKNDKKISFFICVILVKKLAKILTFCNFSEIFVIFGYGAKKLCENIFILLFVTQQKFLLIKTKNDKDTQIWKFVIKEKIWNVVKFFKKKL